MSRGANITQPFICGGCGNWEIFRMKEEIGITSFCSQCGWPGIEAVRARVPVRPPSGTFLRPPGAEPGDDTKP